VWNPDDLIVAPATVRAGAARAIVRVAGRGLVGLLERLFSIEGDARETNGPRLVDARLQDERLVAEFGPLPLELLRWPDGSGPIGGPLAEIQLPGSVPLVDRVVGRAIELGARLARGGEFALRAFLARRIDLLQAEAVLAVVDSRSPEELSAALDRMAGGVGRRLEAVREALLDLAGDIEATIDFGDELGEEAVREHERAVAARLEAAGRSLREVAGHLSGRGAAASERPRVVLVGRPNIGKSSLFNILVGRDAALVADEPGTTRDWIDARTTFGDVECVVVDVAGVDAARVGETSSVGEASMAVAVRQAASADVLVVCTDAEAEPDPSTPHPRRIDVLTRCDRISGRPDRKPLPHGSPAIMTSAVDGRGIDSLRRAIAAAAAEAAGRDSLATQRLLDGVARAREAIAEAAATMSAASGTGAFDEAVVASHVGRAVAAIGEVTGREVGTDILDRIFSRHCIGK
jgi:tRNA modification GTPase